MRILVTGAGGVVGAALIRRLRGIGLDPVALVSRADGDLEDFAATTHLFARIRPTHVYHLAGAVYGLGGNSAFPGDVYFRNILINTHVIEAGRRAGAAKIVAMGSAAIYSDDAPRPFCEDRALVGSPHGSELAYATAKRAMLVQLMSYQRQFELDWAYAIATNMFGPGDRFDSEHGHVVPSLIRKFLEASRSGRSVEIWGDGSPTRDFLHADDAAAGLTTMMERGDGAYNLATGHSHSIHELVEAISSFFPGVHYGWDASRPLGQISRTYEVSRMMALGWAPRLSLAEGIADTITWARENAANLRN